MKKTSPFVTLLLAAGVLLTVGFACGRNETPPAANTGATAANNSPAGGNTSATPSATPSAKPAVAVKNIAGDYAASGRNADGGGSYEAALVVTERGDVYQFSWDSAGRQYDGVGVRVDDRVAVSFAGGTNGKGCGVTLYRIKPDGGLDGVAGYWGNNAKETETAVRTSGTGLEGDYEISGTNPDGDNYKAKLNVKKEGEGFRFAWSGTNSLEGFGVRQGDFVSVGFGGSQCGFVAYEIKSDGTLDGRWGSSGSTELGTETARKK